MNKICYRLVTTEDVAEAANRIAWMRDRCLTETATVVVKVEPDPGMYDDEVLMTLIVL